MGENERKRTSHGDFELSIVRVVINERRPALVELENRSRDISVSAEAGTEGTVPPVVIHPGVARARANKSDRTHRARGTLEMETRFGPRDQRTRYKLKQISRVILINSQPRINNSLPLLFLRRDYNPIVRSGILMFCIHVKIDIRILIYIFFKIIIIDF